MKVKYRTNLCAGIISLIFGLAVLWLIPAQIVQNIRQDAV